MGQFLEYSSQGLLSGNSFGMNVNVKTQRLQTGTPFYRCLVLFLSVASSLRVSPRPLLVIVVAQFPSQNYSISCCTAPYASSLSRGLVVCTSCMLLLSSILFPLTHSLTHFRNSNNLFTLIKMLTIPRGDIQLNSVNESLMKYLFILSTSFKYFCTSERHSDEFQSLLFFYFDLGNMKQWLLSPRQRNIFMQSAYKIELKTY